MEKDEWEKGEPITRRYARYRDGQIHLCEAGPADAPVIAIYHQTASSGVMFEKGGTAWGGG